MRHVVIAQPMALGDLTASLPMAGAIKRRWPECAVSFATRAATRPLVEACEFVDGWLDADALRVDPRPLAALGADAFVDPFGWPALARAAWRARVPIRVGNWRRLKTIAWCNRFVHVSRVHSDRHSVQINLEFLRPLGVVPPREVHGLYGLTRLAALPARFAAQLDEHAFNLVLHPKSGGEGREWPPAHYLRLIERLPPRFRFLLTGVERERAALERECPELLRHPRVRDLAGRLELPQMIALLAGADGIVASGTGPLHIAAALGRHALGIFPPRRDIDAGRWAPVGPRAQSLSLPRRCRPGPETCDARRLGPPCACTAAITPELVAARVAGLAKPVSGTRAAAA